MAKLNRKDLIASIIDDLYNNLPLSQIFIKVQVLAYHLKHEEFSKWVQKEREGYKTTDSLPRYRKFEAILCANLNTYSRDLGWFEYEFPPGKIDPQYEIYHCNNKIAELETISRNSYNNSTIIDLPKSLYPIIQRNIEEGWYVDDAYHKVPSNVYSNVLDSIRSKLLKFMLEIDDQIGNEVNFNNIMTKKKEVDGIVQKIIYAGLYQEGGSNSTISNSNVGGSNNSIQINSTEKGELENIISKIEGLAKEIETDRDDIAEEIAKIKIELSNTVQRPKIIKSALNALKGIAVGVAANKITPLIDQGLKLLN